MMQTPDIAPRTARALDDQDQVLLNEALGRKPEPAPKQRDWKAEADRYAKLFVRCTIALGLVIISSMLIRIWS